MPLPSWVSAMVPMINIEIKATVVKADICDGGGMGSVRLTDRGGHVAEKAGRTMGTKDGMVALNKSHLLSDIPWMRDLGDVVRQCG